MTPVPTPSSLAFTPTVTPVATPRPSIDAPSSITAGVIDIRCLAEFEVGKQKISVFVDGSPAAGKLSISDGAGRSFERVLERDGSTEFYFDKPGEWVLTFGGSRKTLRVRERDALTAPVLNDLRNNEGVAGSGASSVTGFFFWGVAPEWIAVALLLLALAGVAYYRFYYSKPRLRKKIDGKRVRLEVSSGGRSLEDVVLTDYAPDEASVSALTEKASVSETVTGKVLKWKRDLLRSGEIWLIEYELNNASGTRVKRAEAVASANGKRVSLFS